MQEKQAAGLEGPVRPLTPWTSVPSSVKQVSTGHLPGDAGCLTPEELEEQQRGSVSHP